MTVCYKMNSVCWVNVGLESAILVPLSVAHCRISGGLGVSLWLSSPVGGVNFFSVGLFDEAPLLMPLLPRSF